MDRLKFTWSLVKAKSNFHKHKVSFEEACDVFQDEAARLLPDPDHSIAEDRFILLGLSALTRILVVVHVYRNSDEEIRIISARKANNREKRQYQQWRKS